VPARSRPEPEHSKASPCSTSSVQLCTLPACKACSNGCRLRLCWPAAWRLPDRESFPVNASFLPFNRILSPARNPTDRPPAES
jgi:hypothetical protein